MANYELLDIPLSEKKGKKLLYQTETQVNSVKRMNFIRKTRMEEESARGSYP